MRVLVRGAVLMLFVLLLLSCGGGGGGDCDQLWRDFQRGAVDVDEYLDSYYEWECHRGADLDSSRYWPVDLTGRGVRRFLPLVEG